MAYLPQPLRDTIDKHGNKLGILALSDAEYYGGGSLPNAIAEPYIYSMTEAVKRNVDTVILRLNLHDRTPYGSLWNTSAIQFEQSAALLWQNPPPPAQVWENWIRRTYGAAAAPLISEALSNSCKIIYTGFWNQIGKASKLSAADWLPQNGAIAKFARPAAATNTPAPAPTTAIESRAQPAAQLGANYKTETFAQFAQKNQTAAAEVRRSLDLIEQARPMLAKPDYVYLHEIHNTARVLLEVYYAMNQAAYAANLVKDNYDNNPDPKAYFEQAMRALEQCAASADMRWLSTQRAYVYGDIGGELKTLITAYRKL